MAISNNKKKAVGIASLAVGTLALIGAGTGAALNDSVDANWTMKAGDAKLEIVQPNGVTVDGKTAYVTTPTLLDGNRHYDEYNVVGTFGVKNTGDVPVKISTKETVSPELASFVHPTVEFQGTTNGWLAPDKTATVFISANVDAFGNEVSGTTGTVAIHVNGTA